MRRITDIIVHCSATEDGLPFDVHDITSWHKQEGKRTCGYHFVVTLDGTVQVGRPIEQIGEHCRGQNAHSIGVCYIGGLRHGLPCDTRTKEQKEALARLLWRLTLKLINSGQGIPEIWGHHDFNAAKDCPCFNARAEYN